MQHEHPSLTPIEEQAFQLSRCAILIDLARQEEAANIPPLSAALEENLQMWVALAQLTAVDGSPFSLESAENIVKLSNYVSQETFSLANGVSAESLDALININLQVCEGLLEGAKRIEPRLQY